MWVLDRADQTGGLGWVVLQLRFRGDCQSLRMLRSRRCKVSHHYYALSLPSNGALPYTRGNRKRTTLFHTLSAAADPVEIIALLSAG